MEWRYVEPAACLVLGPGFDFQGLVRFSPDGKQVEFVTDDGDHPVLSIPVELLTKFLATHRVKADR